MFSFDVYYKKCCEYQYRRILFLVNKGHKKKILGIVSWSPSQKHTTKYIYIFKVFFPKSLYTVRILISKYYSCYSDLFRPDPTNYL